MADVLETDLFLVERGGQNYQTPGSNMAELLDDDLMLVDRNGTLYQATGLEIKESLGDNVPVYGSIAQPTVLGPQQAEITGGLVYLKSDEIIALGEGGTVTCQTDKIEKVDITPNVWEGVQEGTATVGQMSNLWNGFSNENANNGCDVANSGDCKFTFNVPVPVTSGTWQFQNSGGANYSNIWSWEDDTGVHSMSGGSGIHSTGWGVDSWSPQPVGAIKWVQIGNSTGFTVSNLMIDGANINSNAPQYASTTTLSFPTTTGFDCFPDGTVVQTGSPNVTVISQDKEVIPPTITVSGGNWNAFNDSEVWSANPSGNWSNPQYIFDGNLTSIGYGDKGQVNLPTIVAQESIQAYFYTGDMATAGSAADQWEINNVNISALHPNQGAGTENLQWVDVSSAFTFPVTVSRIRTAQNNQGGMGGIMVDGKVLLDAVNDSQVWSSTRWVNVNNTGWLDNRGPDKAFNGAGPGNAANTSVALDGSPIEFLLNGEFAGTWTAYVGGLRKVFVDDTEVYDGSSGDLTVQTFTTTASNQKIIFKENPAAAADADGAIAGQLTFNGELLVDPVDDSQVWSNGTVNTITGSPLPITNAFDGNLVDSYFSGNGSNQEATFTFDSPIPFTELTFHYQMNEGNGGNNNDCELYINGVLVQDTNSSGSANGGTNGRPVATKVFSSQVTSPLTSIGYKFGQNGSQVRIYGIATESGLLVDTGSDGTRLVKVLPYNTTITCKSNKDLNNCFSGASVMTDGTIGPYSITPYLIQSDTIVTVGSSGDTDQLLLLDGVNNLNNFRIGDPAQSTFLIGQKDGTSSGIPNMNAGTKCWVWHFNNPVSGRWVPSVPNDSTGTTQGDIFPLTIVYSDTTPGAGTSVSYTEADCSAGKVLEFTDVTNIWVTLAKLPSAGSNYAPAPRFGYFELTTGEKLYGGSGTYSVSSDPNFTWPSDQTWGSLPVGPAGVGINNTSVPVKSPSSVDPTVIVDSTIVSISEANSSITVTGGSWSGSDGSGDQPKPDADNSLNWKSIITMSPKNNPDNAFDYNLNTFTTATQGGEMNVVFRNPPTINKLELYTNQSQGSINLGNENKVNFSGTGWYEVPINQISGGVIVDGTQISIDSRNTSATSSVAAWRVNDKIVVLQSINVVGGATKVAYQTNGGQGDVVGVSGNDIYINASTNPTDRWIVDQGFSVGGPTCVEEPTLTADIELTSSAFVLEPTDPEVNPGISAGDKRFVWTINGVEQVGVNVNPWQPGFLQTDTLYTVSVRQEDYSGQYTASPESPDFSFTTGAALNLYSLFAAEIAAYKSTL